MTDPDSTAVPTAHSRTGWTWSSLGIGLLLGFLGLATAAVLGLITPSLEHGTRLGAPLAIALLWSRPGLTRGLVAIPLVGLALLMALTIWTPLPSWIHQQLTVDDGPGQADAIVVLSASTTAATMNVRSLERFAHGVALLHEGRAPTIVFTGAPRHGVNYFNTMAPDLMKRLGLDTTRVTPFAGLTHPPAYNTYGEAQAIAAMAQTHGWQRIILVTSPTHTRRAKATFEKAGLSVLSSPCPTDTQPFTGMSALRRLEAVRPAMREIVGLLTYRLRGRL